MLGKEGCKPPSTSILASSTDFERIQQIPHSAFKDFRANKTLTIRWLGGRVQVLVQVRAPDGHLAISKRLFQKTIEGFDYKINGKALGTALHLFSRTVGGTTWACWMGEHKHSAFPSRRQSLRVAIGSLEGIVLPLLRYGRSSLVTRV